MRIRRRIFTAVLVLGAAAFPVLALEQQECLERLAPIDARIVSGEYPPQDVQMAQTMRDQVLQMCGFMNDAEFTALIASFDQMLPPDPEIAAERDAKRRQALVEVEQLDAQREARRAARAQESAQAMELPPVSPILEAPPTATTAVARFINRDDAMAMVDVLDRDRFNGKTRLLYIARPSRDQFREPAAKNHYYVVEADADGNIAQRHVAAIPLGRTNTAALRRGHDEIILQYPVDPPQTQTRFERWSISGSKLVATSDAPAVPWSGRNWDSVRNHFQLATSDGNVMFLGGIRKSRDQVWLGWLKASPNGQILGQGERSTVRGSARAETLFHTPDGGVGIVLDLMASGDDGIESDLETPLIERVNGVDIEGYVFSERRLLIVGPDGSVAWESPGFERSFIWPTMAGVVRSGSLSAIDHVVEVTDRRAAELGGNQNLVTDYLGGRSLAQVRPIGNGFGLLVEEINIPVGNRKIDRKWLFEYRRDGTLTRSDLTAATGHADARFVMLDVPTKGTIYLSAYWDRGSYVVRLDADRKVASYGRITMPAGVSANVMVADGAGVWIAGEGRPSGSREAVWLERLNFGQER
jgi:hypothetical protein